MTWWSPRPNPRPADPKPLLEAATPTAASRYRDKKAAERARNAKRSAAGRNIGPPPPVVDQSRRERGRLNGADFLREYFPAIFCLPFSADHLLAIRLADQLLAEGGLQALAMPRGTGKSSMFERLTLRALLYRMRRYALLLGTSAEAAQDGLETIKSELLHNDLLFEDFPEVCHPIRELAGIANRAKGQHIDGLPTSMQWHRERLILPTVNGSAASGGVIQAKGILGRLRGLKVKTPTGQIRPDLVVPDDPQTDQSARSQYQIARRLAVLRGTVLGLAGPNQPMTAFCPCTVIAPGDVADQLLDREKCPEWHGLRVALMKSWPTNKALWEKYYDLRAEEMRADLPREASTAFYAANRVAMDEGAEASWAERYQPGQLSAIQFAMDLIQERGQEAVDAEFQNSPRASQSANISLWLRTADELAQKLWTPPKRSRELAPSWATTATAFIDVQQRLLYWAVIAWGQGFRGHMVRYGTWPQQPAPLFTYATARHTIASKYSGGLTAQLSAALRDCASWIEGLEIPTANGLVKVERIGIDTGWKPSVAHELARGWSRPKFLLPCKGQGLGPENRPFSEYQLRAGEESGHHWRETPQPRWKTRLFHIDVNEWKTRLHQSLAAANGDPESLTLPAGIVDGNSQLIAHLLAENVQEQTANGRTVFCWELPSNKPDNHWFDCATGAMALASRCGITAGAGEAPPKKASGPALTADIVAAYNRAAQAARYR